MMHGQENIKFAESFRATLPSCSFAGGHSYGNSVTLSLVILILLLTVWFFWGGWGSTGQFLFYAGSMILIERKNYYSKHQCIDC